MNKNLSHCFFEQLVGLKNLIEEEIGYTDTAILNARRRDSAPARIIRAPVEQKRLLGRVFTETPEALDPRVSFKR